jgi:aspartyl-tRNA(Asn)/glutamyl-tRNA(Gln) amidotransferase subunit A
MSVGDLALRSASELSSLVVSGQLSPVDLTQVFIDRSKQYDRLNAYITLDEEGALRQAKAAENEIKRGAIRGPLHGLPVAVKDQFDAKGLRTTVGSTIIDYVADKDATAIARLREAGAVILGKLNLSEFALGGNVTHAHGIPHNPWDETRQAGQSSSGSGIAVAASLAAAALGGDTAGSVRGPAAWCGITGLRPTWGRVSRYGAWPMAWFMDTIGPMAKTVADCAMLFEAIAGYDPKDPNTSSRPIESFEPRSDLKGLRVGLIRESIDNGMATDDIVAGVETALDVLRSLGATVVDETLPLFKHGGLISNGLADVEAAMIHRHFIRGRSQDYDFASRRRLMAASLTSGTTYAKLARFRMLMRQDVMAALGRVDVLVTPTQAEEAPKLPTSTGLMSKEAVMRQFFGLRAHRGPFNLSGVPAMALPIGFTPADPRGSHQGLPMSLQVIGGPFAENTVFEVGHAYQQMTDWHEWRPALEG